MSSPATEAMAEHARHVYRKPDAARAALLAAHGHAGGCDLCGASKADAVHVAATMRPRLVRVCGTCGTPTCGGATDRYLPCDGGAR